MTNFSLLSLLLIASCSLFRPQNTKEYAAHVQLRINKYQGEFNQCRETILVNVKKPFSITVSFHINPDGTTEKMVYKGPKSAKFSQCLEKVVANRTFFPPPDEKKVVIKQVLKFPKL